MVSLTLLGGEGVTCMVVEVGWKIASWWSVGTTGVCNIKVYNMIILYTCRMYTCKLNNL